MKYMTETFLLYNFYLKLTFFFRFSKLIKGNEVNLIAKICFNNIIKKLTFFSKWITVNHLTDYKYKTKDSLNFTFV